jgi:hypothetical protein
LVVVGPDVPGQPLWTQANDERTVKENALNFGRGEALHR